MTRERRHRERANRVLPLGAQPKHRAARGEDLEPPAAREELVELGGDTHDLFEVVQHEQGRRFTQMLDHDVESPPRAFDAGADGGGDAREHELRLGYGSEGHEHCSLRVPVLQSLGHGDGQSGLADPARAGEGDEPHLRRRQQGRDGGDVRLAPYEGRRRRRKRTRHLPASGSKRLTPVRGHRGPAEANRSLSNRARSSRTSRPSSREVRNDR